MEVSSYTCEDMSYGSDVDLSYNFDVLNSPTQVEDADDSTYLCTVTCDANGNITELKEATLDEEEEELAVFYTNYYYDWANRLTEHRTRT